jgi:mRNA-degrading endonuclease RelE of RelBE toxin-antitoxin system
LRPPLAGTWSARRGTYRILYEINHQTRTVTITAVEARSDAYRRR